MTRDGRWRAALAGVFVILTGSPVVAGFCPNGEITLQTASPLRVLRRGPGADAVIGRRASFVVPAGAAIAPGDEAVTLVLEADRREVLRRALPAGALAGKPGGEAFVLHAGGTRLALRRTRGVFRLDARLRGLDLAALDPAHPPTHLKELLKIGDDCFSAVLACAARGDGIVCRPERSALLAGRVESPGQGALAGVMVTAYDLPRLESVSVFTQEDGRYAFPPLRPGGYRLRARLVGWEDAFRDDVALADGKVTKAGFTLAPAADVNAQLSASAWFSLLLDKWPDPKIRGDFTLSCGNCHQIAAYRFRRTKTEAEWRETLQEMMTFLPPYFQETRDRLVDNVLATYGPGRARRRCRARRRPRATCSAPSSTSTGSAMRRAVRAATTSSSARTASSTRDAGVRWIDPRTGERGTHPITGGAPRSSARPTGTCGSRRRGATRSRGSTSARDRSPTIRCRR
jgi:hypothetical protein